MTRPSPEHCQVDASEVVEGELVCFLGRTHRITSIEPYEHPWGVCDEGVRVAREGADWAITLEPGTLIEVIR